MKTVQEYITQLQKDHSVIVQEYVDGYETLEGLKSDAEVSNYYFKYKDEVQRKIAEAAMEVFHKAVMEGLEGNKQEFTDALLSQQRAAFAEFVTGMGKFLTGEQPFELDFSAS